MNKYSMIYLAPGCCGRTNLLSLDVILDIEYLNNINIPPRLYVDIMGELTISTICTIYSPFTE